MPIFGHYLSRLGADNDDESCISGWNVLDYGLGWFLIVGTIVSFLPQHLKIYQEKTHKGLSFAGFWAANFTAYFSLINYVAISAQGTFYCCAPGTTFMDCSGAYLAFVQLVVNHVCQHLIVVLYVVYYDHKYANELEFEAAQVEEQSGTMIGEIDVDHSTVNHDQDEVILSLDYRRSRFWCGFQFIVEVIGTSFLFFFYFNYGVDSNTLYIFGIFCMGVTGVFACFQMLPQILETYHFQDTGSLSILTVIMQGAGALLVAVNLQPHGSWEIWTPYLILASLNFVLLVEITYLYCNKKKATKEGRILGPNRFLT